ncbi:MAG: ABC transporter ATP-binding protein, partial [Myxococcaceae bacterium]
MLTALRFFASDKKNWLFFAIQLGLSFITSALGSLELVAVALFIPTTSRFSQLHDFVTGLPITWILLGLLSLFLIRSIFNYASAVFQEYWNLQSESKQRAWLLRHMMAQPMSELEHREPGELAKRLELEATQLSQIPTFIMTYCIRLPITLIQVGAVCWFVSWKLFLVLVPVFGIYYLLRNKISKVSSQTQNQFQKRQSLEHAKLINLFQGLSILKLFGAEDSFLKSYFDLRTKIEENRIELVKYRHFYSEIIAFTLAISLMSGIGYVFFILHSSVQDILLVLGSLKQLHSPFKNYAEQMNQTQRAAVLIEKTQQKLIQRGPSLNRVRSSIEFDSVSFTYPNGWSLKPISFAIQPGEKIALVGPNGSGKSTILKLIAGFYPTYSGHIYLNSPVSYTLQKPFLFSGTIRENIAFYQDLDQSLLEEACLQSCAAEFIEKMPGGYDSYLANDGSSLSGGQRQKIHLARTFARKTPILLLDEATVSLDLESEQNILANCRKHTWQTQIVVSHRKEILNWADRVIELN